MSRGGNKIFGTLLYLKRLREIRSRTGLDRFGLAHSFNAERRTTGGPRGGPFGTWIASGRIMTDESYVSLLLWTICVLMFACGVMAITEHPDWFGA
ncbi:MAG TPA: hypothetical protein VJ353_03425 [Xanthobacteraceae bacterium]|jgi:hypothetical protein|nr:hypothetical protein [Xanthobacteraceae bacterium]